MKEQQENTLACVLNLSAAFLLQLCVVVPLSVFVLVVQNWVLGSFVCYMLPMIQVRSERNHDPLRFDMIRKLLPSRKLSHIQRELKSDPTNWYFAGARNHFRTRRFGTTMNDMGSLEYEEVFL